MFDLNSLNCCATCRRSINPEKEQVNICIIDYMREWEFPATGNVLSGFRDYRASTIVCKDCFSKPFTHAVQLKDGKMIYHPIDQLVSMKSMMEQSLPPGLEGQSPVEQIEAVFHQLLWAGKEKDALTGSLMADWLYTKIKGFLPYIPNPDEAIFALIRVVYNHHLDPKFAMEDVRNCFNFSVPVTKQFHPN